ncbi:hypothetical protein [Streptomyces sp. NPDC019890]|uniref:hypothetical protein n=1 Tax=Streptomyces sp. NPDC019890 TaxID=3365064 RepID=UPI003851533E
MTINDLPAGGSSRPDAGAGGSTANPFPGGGERLGGVPNGIDPVAQSGAARPAGGSPGRIWPSRTEPSMTINDLPAGGSGGGIGGPGSPEGAGTTMNRGGNGSATQVEHPATTTARPQDGANTPDTSQPTANTPNSEARPGPGESMPDSPLPQHTGPNTSGRPVPDGANSAGADIKPGNILALRDIPLGTTIHAIELRPGGGAQAARSAGASARLIAKEGQMAHLRLRSGEIRRVDVRCRATVSGVGNAESVTAGGSSSPGTGGRLGVETPVSRPQSGAARPAGGSPGRIWPARTEPSMTINDLPAGGSGGGIGGPGSPEGAGTTMNRGGNGSATQVEHPDSGSGTTSVSQRPADVAGAEAGTERPAADGQSGTPRPGADIHPDASRPGADNQSAALTSPPTRPQDLRWDPDAAHTVLTNPDLDPATANSALANASTILTVRAHQVLPGVDPRGIAPLVPRPESRPGVVIHPAMVRAQHLVAAEILRHGVLSGQVLAGQILPGSVQPGGEVPPVLYGATYDPAQDTVQLGAHTVPLTGLPDFLQENMGWLPGRPVVLPVPLTPAAPGVPEDHGITELTLPEVLAEALGVPVIVPVAADWDPATTLMWVEVGPDGELNGAAHSLGALLSDDPQRPPTAVKTEATTAPDKGKGKAADLEAGTEPQPGPLPVVEWGDEAEARQAYADAERAVFAAQDMLADAEAAHAAGVESSDHADGSAVTAASVRVADALAHLSEVERQLDAVTGSEPLPVVEEVDGPVNGPQRAAGVLTGSSVGAPPPNLADLLNEVNLHLHNRGDVRVAGAEEIASAYQQLPADLRFAHLRLMAQGIADILQTGQVIRRRGGSPTLLSTQMPQAPGRQLDAVTGSEPGVPDNHGITELTLPEVPAEALDAPVIVPVAEDRDPATTLMWAEVGPDGELNGAVQSLGALLSDDPQRPPTAVETEAGATTATDKGKGKAADLVELWEEGEAHQALKDAERAVFEAEGTLAAAEAAHAAGVESSSHADGSAVAAASARVADARAHLAHEREAEKWEIARIALKALGTGFVLGGSLALHAHKVTDRPAGDVDIYTHAGDPEKARKRAASALRVAGYQVDTFDTHSMHEQRVYRPGKADNAVSFEITNMDLRDPAGFQIDGMPVMSIQDCIYNKADAARHRGHAKDFFDLSNLIAVHGVDVVYSGLGMESLNREMATIGLQKKIADVFDESFSPYGVPGGRVRQSIQNLTSTAKRDVLARTVVDFSEGSARVDAVAEGKLTDFAEHVVQQLRANVDPDRLRVSIEAGGHGWVALRATLGGAPGLSGLATRAADAQAGRTAAKRAGEVRAKLVDHLTQKLIYDQMDPEQAKSVAKKLVQPGKSVGTGRPRVASVDLAKSDIDNRLHLRGYDGRMVDRNDLEGMRSFINAWVAVGKHASVRLLLHRLQVIGPAQRYKELDRYYRQVASQTESADRAALPKKIPMYWAGNQPSAEALANIEAWATEAQNRGWRLHLWTDDSFDMWPEQVRDRLRNHLTVHTNSESLVEQQGGAAAKEVYKEAKNRGVHTMVSDLVRFAILSDQTQGGGVYLDVDIDPGDVDLEALEGIMMHPEDLPVFAPRLRDMASVKDALRHAKLDHITDTDQQISRAAEHMYRRGFLNTNVIISPAGSVFAQRALEGIPLRYQRFKDNFNANYGEEAHARHADLFSRNLKESAGNISGPGLLQESNYLPKGTPDLMSAYAQDIFGAVSLEDAGTLKPSLGQHETTLLFDPQLTDWISKLRLVTPESENTLDRPAQGTSHGAVPPAGSSVEATAASPRQHPTVTQSAPGRSATPGRSQGESSQGPFVGMARSDNSMLNGLTRALSDARKAEHPNPDLIRRLEAAIPQWTPRIQPDGQEKEDAEDVRITPPGDAVKTTESALPESDGIVPSGLEPEVSTSVMATETGTGEQVSTAGPSGTSPDKGKGREEGRDRTALLPPAMQAPPADQNPPARTPIDHDEIDYGLTGESPHSVVDHPEEGPAQENPAPLPPPQNYPWYVDHGALGDAEVGSVPKWSDGLAHMWATIAAQYIEEPPIRDAVTQALREILISTDPAEWNKVLATGRTLVVGNQLVWLKPVLTGVRPHGQSAGPAAGPGTATGSGTGTDAAAPKTGTTPAKVPVPPGWTPEGDREFTVGTQSTTRTGARTTTSAASAAVVTAVDLALAQASGASFVPRVSVTASTTESRNAERTVKTAHRTHPEWKDFSAADAGIRFRVFVDGEELKNEEPENWAVVQRDLGVVFPPGLPAGVSPVGALQDGTAAGQAAQGQQPAVQRPVRSPQYLNALDNVPLVTGLHRRLKDAGLPAVTVEDVMTQLEPWLGEKELGQHARWVLTSGLSTGPIEAAIPRKRKPFRGSFTIRAGIDSLQFLGLSEPGPSRGLEGIATKNSAAVAGSSGAAITGGVLLGGLSHIGEDSVVAGSFPDAGITGSSTRSGGYSVSSTATRHTEFKSGQPQVTYAAGLGMSVSVESPTHPDIEPVTFTVQSELGIMFRGRPQAADFERRVLADVHTPEFRPLAAPAEEAARPPLRPGPLGARPHVRALPREGTPLKRDHNRPAQLDEELSAPHPREPLALASRKGGGFATTLALPGAELVQGHFLAALKDKVKDKAKDWTTVERELSSAFGRPAMEQNPGRVFAGYRRTVWVGNLPYRLSVYGHLRERLPSAMDTGMEVMDTGMEVESVVGAGGSVSAHRGTRLGIGANFGGGLRVKIRNLLSLHLGGVHLFAGYGRGKDTSFTGGSKSSRRSKPKGGPDEHAYNIVYELNLTPLKPHGDRNEVLRKPQPDGETETWWLKQDNDVVAEVVVPHAFVPRKPVKPEQAAQAGTAKRGDAWPAQGKRVDFKSGGTAGVVPAFLPAPELVKLAAELYARLNGLGDEWAKNRELWPDEIHALADPAVLESAFNGMVGRFGHEGELPHRKGFEQAFRLRLRTYEPEDLGETPAGVDIVDTKEAGTVQGSVEEETVELGVSATVGGYVTAARAMPEPDPADGPIREQKSAVGPGGGHLYLQGRGWVSKGWSKTNRKEPGQLGRNKAIYKTSPHEVKSLPVFEFTVFRWKKNGEPAGEETGYLSVEDGLQLLVPQRVWQDLEPKDPPSADKAPGTASAGEPPVRPDRDYLTSDIAAGIGRVERLRADEVMDVITTSLQAHGVLPSFQEPDPSVQEPAPSDSPRPDLLTRALHKVFSSEALENQMPDLMGTGVWAWLPVPGFLGATSYIWVRVRAKELEAAHAHRPRTDVKLNVAVAATENPRKDVGTFSSWGGELHGRGGAIDASGRDGFEANAGYRSTSSRTVSEAEPQSEIYDADPQDTAEEFNHKLVFSIEMGGTTELPQVLDLPVTGVHHAVLGMAHHGFDSREPVAKVLNGHRAWTWFEGGSGARQATGDVRILVPSHLTGPAGDQFVPPVSRVYGEEPRWVERPPVSELAAGLLQHLHTLAAPAAPAVARPPVSGLAAGLLRRLHPLAVPAAAAVERWAKLAASTAKRDPDLQAAKAWEVEGVDFTTTAGPKYAHFTGTGMLKANIAPLLGHTYDVPVNGQNVRVGFRLDHARVVGPPRGAVYDAARISKKDPSTAHSEARSSGWSAGAGPRTVGDGAGPTTLYGSAAASGGVTQSSGYAYRDGSNDENPRTGKVKRSHRYYQFDLTVVFEGPQRTLEVKAPRGLFAMLPLGEDGKLLDRLEAALPELFGPDRNKDLPPLRDRNKDLPPLPDTATPAEGAESTVAVPANAFGRRSHGWSGLWSPQLRPIPEEDLANLWVPEDTAEELSLSDESAPASLSRTTAPAVLPVTTESAAPSVTPPPATEPAPAQPGTTMPPRPAIPEAFLDAPRPPKPAEEPVAADGGGVVSAPHQLRLVTPESENTLDRPAQGTSVVGGAGVRTQTEVVDPSTDTGAGADAAMAVDPPTPLAQTQPTYQAVPPQPAARSAWAGEFPHEGAGVGDGGSGIGTAGGAAFEDRPDPAELIRREYQEAADAMAAAAMTLREREAAAALAGSAGTAGCELSVAQAHMQNSSERFNRAKQFWESAFGS